MGLKKNILQGYEAAAFRGAADFTDRCLVGADTGHSTPFEYIKGARVLGDALREIVGMGIEKEALAQILWDAGESLTAAAETVSEAIASPIGATIWTSDEGVHYLDELQPDHGTRLGLN